MTLVLQSNVALDASVEDMDFKRYRELVLADGGVIVNAEATTTALRAASRMGVNADNAVSVASPQWGVKYAEGGEIEKLYCLFNPIGSVNIQRVNSGDLGVSISTQYGFETLSLNGLVNARVQTPSFNFGDTLGICLIEKPKSLSSPLDYNDTRYLTSFDAHKANSPGHKILYSFYMTGGKMPEDWSNRTFFELSSANTDKAGVNSNVVGASTFSSRASHYDDGFGITMFNEGVFDAEGAFEGPHTPIAENIEISYGMRLPQIDRVIHTDIAEFWVLKNIDKGMMQSVSEYAHDRYA